MPAGRWSKGPGTAPSSSIGPATASGETVHGNGVHMDDYETHDDRRLIPGTGFTIEPGVYTKRVRRADRDQHVRRTSATPYVTGPLQTDIVPLG